VSDHFMVICFLGFVTLVRVMWGEGVSRTGKQDHRGTGGRWQSSRNHQNYNTSPEVLF